ncbi:hypothetical protein ABC383_27480 [Noviherbaspirillum sp. 1P10PC]|uniref:hypothetical protein n=1 Tax=Noviherbaspirillum sp. 1P10PC TaxID=3132292 RepID=UPI00399FD7CB
MNRASVVLEDDVRFLQLLAEVRARIDSAGCADRLDAKAWLERWLVTPNPAFGGALPRDVYRIRKESAVAPPDVAAELMGRLERESFQVSPRHW